MRYIALFREIPALIFMIVIPLLFTIGSIAIVKNQSYQIKNELEPFLLTTGELFKWLFQIFDISVIFFS